MAVETRRRRKQGRSNSVDLPMTLALESFLPADTTQYYYYQVFSRFGMYSKLDRLDMPRQQKIKFVNIFCSNLTFLQGGLTTPDCNEAVLWTNMKSTQTISEAQLAVFRSMTDSDGTSLNNNYRPPLPLNSRTIYTTGVSKFSKDCCFIITSSSYTAW